MDNQTDPFGFGGVNEVPQGESTLTELGSSLPKQMKSVAELWLLWSRDVGAGLSGVPKPMSAWHTGPLP